MELQVEEHFFFSLLQPCDDISAECIEELHAHLVIADARTKPLHETLCIVPRRHIECRNQPFVCHCLTPL